MKRMLERIKQACVFLVKLAISATLLTWLIVKAGPDSIMALLTSINAFPMITAVLCYAAIMAVSALRLGQLIQPPMPFRTLFSISAIGYFYNLFLPSGISGDVARVYYLNKETKGKWNNSLIHLATPFIMERYIGLGSIVTTGVIATPFALQILADYQLMPIAGIMAILLLVMAIAGLGFFKAKPFRRNHIMKNFYDAVDLIKEKGGLKVTFILSLLIQFISIVAVLLISEGMGLRIPWPYFFIMVPMINIITILPVALGGVGLREGAFVFFLSFRGISSQEAISLSLLSFALSMVASIIGLYEYLRYRSKPRHCNDKPSILQVGEDP